MSGLESTPLKTNTYWVSFRAKQIEVYETNLPNTGVLDIEFKITIVKLSNYQINILNNFHVSSLKQSTLTFQDQICPKKVF